MTESSRIDRRVPRHRHRAFVLLRLSKSSEKRLSDFLVDQLNFPRSRLKRNLHITLYEARRRLEGLSSFERSALIRVPSDVWRFMVVAPGGENPRPDIDQLTRPLALRTVRTSDAYQSIQKLRSEFLAFETDKVLSGRRTSGPRRNAFGSRHYQPHVTLIGSGHGIEGDLSEYGEVLRRQLGDLEFDKLSCRVFDNSDSL